jgi:hypothetical protein
MRPETGQAVLTAATHLPPAGAPPLSALASRVAATRGASLPPAGERVLVVLPTPARDLCAVPPPSRASGSAAHRRQSTNGLAAAPALGGPAECCRVLAVHGGAGVSSLLRAGLAEAGAVDAYRRWPLAGPVLLVARTSVGALELVQDAARQHAIGAWPDVELVGLALLADAPGRLPGRVAALADLVCGAFPRVWLVPWLEEWRVAARNEPLPVHPEVARLCTDVRALTGARSHRQGEHR